MKTITLRNIVSLFSILIFSCFASCSHEDGNTNLQSTTVNPTLIGNGALYGDGAENIPQQNLVITSMAQWNSLKAQMNTVNNATADFNENGIDFSNCKIIASFDKINPNGGNQINNNNIVENANNITVTIQMTGSTEPFVTTVMTQPFSIVRIPISPKPIIFN